MNKAKGNFGAKTQQQFKKLKAAKRKYLDALEKSDHLNSVYKKIESEIILSDFARPSIEDKISLAEELGYSVKQLYLKYHQLTGN